MRNHTCPFANHCPNYGDDRCQGCSRAINSLYGLRSKITGVPEIKKVIFNRPATIVFWADGTKTVVRCQEDENWSEYVGLSMAISKKALGNKGNFNDVFKKWVPGYGD